MKPFRVIITGATGMVGEGVLHECLLNSSVSKVLIINRKPSGIAHSKLSEVIHKDFFDISKAEESLSGFDACFFCLGVSSVGKKEEEYRRLTHTLTMHFASTLSRLNPQMIFCYVSGSGTDSSEKGRLMWARVKGKTENDLMKLSFQKVYNFRPGVIIPDKRLKNTLVYYKYFGWLLPVIRAFAPGFICSLSEVGTAMIHSVTKGYNKQVLEVADIRELAKS